MPDKTDGKQKTAGKSGGPGLEEAVRAAIDADPGMRGYELNVKARGREVVLTGVVDVLAEKERLRAIAAAVPGVERVEADLTVSTDGPLDDREVAMEVSEELAAHPDLDPKDVGVEVREGVAHLVGRVSSEAEEEQAIATAAKARGVKEVQSHLERGGKGHGPG